MRRSSKQRLYESIMKVVDRSVRKALNEANMAGIGGLDTSDVYKIYNKVLDRQKVSESELQQLDKAVAIYKVRVNKELRDIIEFYSDNYPYNSLNWLDVSGITDMKRLFYNTKFDGDISKWDVSNVQYMDLMFAYSDFNNVISEWDVAKVKSMLGMFNESYFNRDISGWDVSNVKNMAYMFYHSRFNQDISRWNVSEVDNMNYMFTSSIFNQDISDWNVSNVRKSEDIFKNCPIKKAYKPIK